MTLQTLAPSQRFMYEYGCFVAFWSNFEMLMEVAIWKESGADAKTNCEQVNGLTAGKKRQRLSQIYQTNGATAKLAALDDLFDVAERNDWIHGHILNPNGDFSVLTRLRVKINRGVMDVSNTPIQFTANQFQPFYDAYQQFLDECDVTIEEANQYIRDLQS